SKPSLTNSAATSGARLKGAPNAETNSPGRRGERQERQDRGGQGRAPLPPSGDGKTVRRSKKYHAHDEKGEYKAGDVVRIQECRPLSKLKTWEVVERVSK